MQMSFRSSLRSIIGNIKETFPLKTGMWKKQVCKIQGMSKESTFISHVEGVESLFNLHCVTAVFLMLKESKVYSIYTVDPSTKF